jgi:lysophospholipase L1-like esterase
VRGEARKAPWATPLLVAASLLVSVAAAETVLRSLVPAPRSYGVWPPHLEVTFHPSPGLMPGIEGPSRFTVNALGLRGEEWSEDHRYRILAIGGSTTESLYLDDSEAWPRVLQDLLNTQQPAGGVWVGNAGRSGLNSRHHVIHTLRLLEQHPGIDAIIVMAGINDLHQRLSLDDDFRPIDQEPRSRFERLYREAFAVLPELPPSPPLFVPVELRHRIARLGRSGTQAPLAQQQDAAGLVYERWRRHRREASALRDELPDLGSALREFAFNLETIVGLARRHEVRVVLATQPVLWGAELSPEQRSLLWMGGVGNFQAEPRHEYYTVAALADAMERYNETLLGVCTRSGGDCVDLAASLPRDTRVFYDDCHFNESGARLVAERFAQHFRGRRLASR